jgi:hypothetical protein
MPYIPKNRIKEKQTPYIKEDRSRKFYNTTIWINLRRRWLREHPFCVACDSEGKTTLATDIHHLRPFLTGVDDDEKWRLFVDEDNLVSLCDKHHHQAHNGTLKL